MQTRCKCGSNDTIIGVFSGRVVMIGGDVTDNKARCYRGEFQCHSCGLILEGPIRFTAAMAMGGAVEMLSKFIVLSARGELGDES